MAGTGSNDFQHPPAAHHHLIIAHLEALERGEIQRLMILAPPGSAKSTYCSIQFPLWRLARQPDKNILCASNTQDLAEAFNRRRRNIALTILQQVPCLLIWDNFEPVAGFPKGTPSDWTADEQQELRKFLRDLTE